jgi:hypothetical protein
MPDSAEEDEDPELRDFAHCVPLSVDQNERSKKAQGAESNQSDYSPIDILHQSSQEVGTSQSTA